VSTRYILSLPGITSVIIGSRLSPTSSKYITQNLQAFTFELDAQDIQDIEKSQEGLKDVPGENGDEYRRKPFLTAKGDLSDHLGSGEEMERKKRDVERVCAEGGRVEVGSGSPWEPIAVSLSSSYPITLYVSAATACSKRGSRVILLYLPSPILELQLYEYDPFSKLSRAAQNTMYSKQSTADTA
jgi:hypothetical protein